MEPSVPFTESAVLLADKPLPARGRTYLHTPEGLGEFGPIMSVPSPTNLAVVKYHGLGNDYMVIEANALDPWPELDVLARALCDRHYGPGADGILINGGPDNAGRWRLRIVNPDGSEAEKSGNGLRIFARYLWDRGQVSDSPFAVSTAGGVVSATVRDCGRQVAVEMGRASFDAAAIPVADLEGEVLRKEMIVGAQRVEYSAVTIGNPHCVIIGRADAGLARRMGPLIEVEPRFVNRTNVQFVEISDRSNIRIEIWERGAGYTLASGSSSCAAAAVARRLGLVEDNVTVNMPGGALAISVSDDFSLHMLGPVVKVFDGRVSAEALV